MPDIPGTNRAVAEVIVVETGGCIGRFPSAGHRVSWAGLCPGHHESAAPDRLGPRVHHPARGHPRRHKW
ncbi:transposase [Streptomyces sp. MMG1121]|uniref:transposase n=1 Tax=Streptomyces sp. MMG1121 TaxID=1415544 RepID=UPI002D21CA5F|nr:transposase [Streptomyces sp. MMG1121]